MNKELPKYRIHELKTWEPYYTDVFMGHKNFELRKNDRNFKVGDKVILKQYDPIKKEYSGKNLARTIIYILEGGSLGLEEGYVILNIE